MFCSKAVGNKRLQVKVFLYPNMACRRDSREEGGGRREEGGGRREEGEKRERDSEKARKERGREGSGEGTKKGGI